MGYKSFQILLDSPSGSYYAGSNVTGRVILVLGKPQKVRGLIIKLDGRANVSWSEVETVTKPNGDRTQESVTYSDEEKYFKIKYHLAGSSNGEIIIPAGENVYPFQATLPPNLPTSLEGEHGYIRYTITATLDKKWKIDEKVKLLINVVRHVDLNLLPQVKEPVKREAKKKFFRLFYMSGPLKLTGSIPYCGYTPGQTIVSTIEVNNDSNVRIAGIIIKLVKELKWMIRTSIHTEMTRVVLCKTHLEGVLPNSSKSWTQNVSIPHIPFINLDSCSIIKCNIYLEVIADPSGPHIDLALKIPITLGTVPLYFASGEVTAEPYGSTKYLNNSTDAIN